MSDDAESSGQALERFMKEQFSVLAIEVPEDDLEMMARFVEEEGLEKDEKVEGVRAMIEGFVDVGLSLSLHLSNSSRLHSRSEPKRADDSHYRKTLTQPSNR
jgi:hypothetical protein